jgi:hypothetical protein
MSARLGCFSVAIGMCTIVTNYTFAADTTPPHRYALDGKAALTADAPVQRGGALRLRATLAPPYAQTEMQSVQVAGRFALSATLGAERPGICYSDTIFRDDFDADGF